MVGIMLVVLMRSDHLPYLLRPQTRQHERGPYGAGNKGGVAFWAHLYGTPICIISSHLAAHTNKVEKRNQDYHSLRERLLFFSSPNHEFVNPLDACHTIWAGDLNYRVDFSGEHRMNADQMNAAYCTCVALA